MAAYYIREIKREDFDEAVQLYITVFSSEPWNDSLTVNQVEQYFNQLYKMNTFLGYLLIESETERIIGTCLGYEAFWFKGSYFFIDSFYISNQYQGKKLGQLFMNHLEAAIKEKEIPAINLRTGKDYPAAHFYKQQDFSELSTYTYFTKEL